jgi:hypothetical protein
LLHCMSHLSYGLVSWYDASIRIVLISQSTSGHIFRTIVVFRWIKFITLYSCLFLYSGKVDLGVLLGSGQKL